MPLSWSPDLAPESGEGKISRLSPSQMPASRERPYSNLTSPTPSRSHHHQGYLTKPQVHIDPELCGWLVSLLPWQPVTTKDDNGNFVPAGPAENSLARGGEDGASGDGGGGTWSQGKGWRGNFKNAFQARSLPAPFLQHQEVIGKGSQSPGRILECT